MLAVGAPQVFQMNAAAAGWLGRMYETLVLLHFVITDQRAKGVATGSDLAIAAIAIAANAAVASSNVKHFLQIHAVFPLPGLFDPMDQMWHVQVKPPS
jgi:predicted nucleic acid-binding protein